MLKQKPWIPVFEGVVDYSPEQESVSNLGGSSESEHVNGPKSRMSLAQAAGSAQEE